MVKYGYKQTDIGVIPNDWETSVIGDLFEFKNGLNKAKEFFGYGTPIVNYMDVFKHYGLKASDIAGKVDVSKEELKAYNVKKGDVFFTRTSETVDEIGITAVVLEDVNDTVFSGFILRARPLNDRLDDYYKKYCFTLQNVRKQITSTASYTTRALTNGKSLSKVQIPIPPKEEQKAIATALSDTDELIEQLQKLISKKEDIKTATMQLLLTGKKRLDGFNDEWEEKSIKELVSTPVTDGPHETPTFVREGIPFLSVNNLVSNRIDLADLRYITKEYDLICAKKCKPQKNDILLGKAASVGKIAIVENDMDFNIWSPIALIRINNKNLPLFFYYAFQTKYILSQIELFTNSSSQGNIGMGDIEKIKFKYPNLEEQTAIATILSDMDKEIETLKSKLSKTKAIKDGMMSELLTGNTRLM